MRESPVFVATFADGETVRMTTHCEGELDWERGRSLAKHAWQTRDRRLHAKTKDRELPEITSHHFEVGGQVIEEPKEVTEPA
jgi:hypothetical protein